MEELRQDDNLLPHGLKFDADGQPVRDSLEAVELEEVLRVSPYYEDSRTPKYIKLQQDRERQREKARDPSIRARKRIGLVVREMMKIGNELKDFRVAADSLPGKTDAQGQVPKFVSSRYQQQFKRPRPRSLPERMLKRKESLAAIRASDLINDWKEEDTGHPADHECKTDTTTEQAVQVAMEASAALEGVQHPREIPGRRDIVINHGHAPKFYGVKRHPPPGRLPTTLDTPEGRSAFKVVPVTDWRTAPEEVVLQKAYAYMLDNVAVSEEVDLAITSSSEMDTNLKRFFDANIGAGFWNDEVTSSVAEPMGMDAFCARRSEQEVNAPSAAGFKAEAVQEEPPNELRTEKFQRVDPRPLKLSPKHAQSSKPAPEFQSECADDPLDIPSIISGKVFRFSQEATEACTMIQRAWRRVYYRKVRAATLIQKIARGMSARLRTELLRREKVAMIILIQTQFRGWLGRRILDYLRMAKSYNLSLQGLAKWELVKIPENIKLSLARQRAEEARQRRDRAVGSRLTNIQSRIRKTIAKRIVSELRRIRFYQTIVAVHLQRVFRGNKTRHELILLKRAVKIGVSNIQAHFRGNRQRKQYKELMAKRNRMAVHVQRIYRGHLGRQQATHSRLEIASATKMCALARGHAARSFVSRWRISRIEAERRRLALENVEIRKALIAESKLTQDYLKSAEGKVEFRIEVRRAKAARTVRKEARQKMAPEELRKSYAEEAFELFDLDGSGEIDESEFKKAVAELCLPLTKAQIQSALEAMDEDGNGVVTLEEFVNWHSDPNHKANQKKAKKKNIRPSTAKSYKDKPARHVLETKAGNENDYDSEEDEDAGEYVIMYGKQKHGAGEKAQFAWAKAAEQVNATVATAIKLKLKATKAMRDLSGFTDRRSASRGIYARRAEAARVKTREEYRKAHPADMWYYTFVHKKKKMA